MKIRLLAVLATLASAASAAPPRNYEAEVLEELNYMRAHPVDYAGDLDDYLTRFDGDVVIGEFGESDLQTREGIRPVLEAARLLRSTKPLGALRYSPVLAQAAADHVAAQSRSGEVGHNSRGLNPGDRVKARGGDIYVGEVIAYGVASPEAAIRQLIVDDGVRDRGHRALMLSSVYRYAGVACGPHPVWRNMCVIDFAETPDGTSVFKKKG